MIGHPSPTYDLNLGHSGDSHKIPFIAYGKPPKDRKERFHVLEVRLLLFLLVSPQRMVAHSQYCWSGDNTVKATAVAIEEMEGGQVCRFFTAHNCRD